MSQENILMSKDQFEILMAKIQDCRKNAASEQANISHSHAKTEDREEPKNKNIESATVEKEDTAGFTPQSPHPTGHLTSAGGTVPDTSKETKLPDAPSEISAKRPGKSKKTKIKTITKKDLMAKIRPPPGTRPSKSFNKKPVWLKLV